MNPTTHQPHRASRLRHRVHTHAWTSAATLAALAFTVIETAGFRNP